MAIMDKPELVASLLIVLLILPGTLFACYRALRQVPTDAESFVTLVAGMVFTFLVGLYIGMNLWQLWSSQPS